MPATKTEELRLLSNEELVAKLKESKEELFNLRFQSATGQLENPLKIRQLRRDIARLKTAERQAR